MNRYIKKISGNIFFKNSLLYTLGSMVTPVVGFVMLPIYTNYLTPDEYGIMTTVQTLAGMLQIFLLLSLHGAVTRFFYDFIDHPQKQKEYLGSIFVFVLFFSSIIVILLLFFNNLIGSLLFKNIPINPFYFYLVILSWITGLSTLPMTLFRVQEKAGLYVTINLVKALLVMGVSIYLIVDKGLGAESVLFSQVSITFIFVLFMFGMQARYLCFSLNMAFVKQSLLFSIPLLPHLASTWIISSSDRIILERFVGIADVGVYSLAVQVSMILWLFYNSVNGALIPRYTRLRKEGNEEKAKRLLKTFLYVVLVFGIISIPVAMYSLKLIISSHYYEAISLIPLLLIGQIVAGIYFIPAAKLFYAKKTKVIATSSVISALISLLISLVAIPLIGIYGAVMSSITSVLFRLLIVYKSSKKM